MPLAMLRRSTLALAPLLLCAACHKPADTNAAAPETNDAAAIKPGLGDMPSATVRPPDAGPPSKPYSGDPASFVPLQSQQVKNAIYRAMISGETQRWKDGVVSGYAVPSKTTGIYGCRAVTYTVDQLRDAPPATINACH